jgi:phosphoglycerol transferase MdoB-like AlkP superfamily enzyme
MHGIRMDLSVIGYGLLPSLFLSGMFLLKPMNWIVKTEYYYNIFILLLLVLMLPANILLFKYWGSLLSFRSLSYLKDAGSILSSFTVIQILIVLIFLLLFGFLIFFFFNKYFFQKLEESNSSIIRKILAYSITVTSFVFLIRGGFQKLPMNESLVSYSEDNFLNQATVNPVWHLSNDIYRAGIFEGNPFEMIPPNEAKEIVKNIFANSPDSFPQILTTKKPNIVIIILESFTADIVEDLGGERGITPSLNRIIKDGLFFNNIYASGTRTDQGIVSLLNGWPAIPYYSIMRSSEKSNHLPSMPKLFLIDGYSTSFFYGGESNFSNLNVYCNTQKFQKVIEQKNFSDAQSFGGWGVPDEYVFARQNKELDKISEPFFSVLMTLSNHEPFDVPGPTRFPGNDDSNKFRNSAAYADACLGNYLLEAKNKQWYKNTLFIIVADHGHELPKNTNVYYPESHRIPLLFYGDVIKPEFNGAVVTKLGGHHDLAGTLLPQLGLNDASQFSWSKNLLNPTVSNYAYYVIDQLVGWVDEKYWFGYSYNRKKFIARSYDAPQAHLDTMRVHGEAFIQVLYDQYKKY